MAHRLEFPTVALGLEFGDWFCRMMDDCRYNATALGCCGESEVGLLRAGLATFVMSQTEEMVLHVDIS